MKKEVFMKTMEDLERLQAKFEEMQITDAESFFEYLSKKKNNSFSA